jgi:hypothetical protein
MSARRRLPNRRACSTFDFESQGLKFTASFSRFADGTISELFIRNHKASSMAGINAASAAPESLAERFARAAPTEWLECARMVGPAIVWDHMIAPLV